MWNLPCREIISLPSKVKGQEIESYILKHTFYTTIIWTVIHGSLASSAGFSKSVQPKRPACEVSCVLNADIAMQRNT